MKTINEDRLFKHLQYFFNNPKGILLEIAQNASRSGASELRIGADENSLAATDNGKGADSIEPLLCLSDTDWPEDVIKEQMPADGACFF